MSLQNRKSQDGCSLQLCEGGVKSGWTQKPKVPAEERGETAMPRNNAAAMNVLPFYYKPWHIDGRRPSLSVVEGSVCGQVGMDTEAEGAGRRKR